MHRSSTAKGPSPEAEAAGKHAIHLEASAKGIAFGAWVGPTWPFSSPTPRSNQESHRYTFLVLAGEKKEAMNIFRLVAAPGKASAFVFDNALTSATVTPPPPFTGSGSFQRNADGSTVWAGALAVEMAGLGSVHLTGPAFKSELANHLVFPEEQSAGNESRVR